MTPLEVVLLLGGISMFVALASASKHRIDPNYTVRKNPWEQ